MYSYRHQFFSTASRCKVKSNPPSKRHYRPQNHTPFTLSPYRLRAQARRRFLSERSKRLLNCITHQPGLWDRCWCIFHACIPWGLETAFTRTCGCILLYFPLLKTTDNHQSRATIGPKVVTPSSKMGEHGNDIGDGWAKREIYPCCVGYTHMEIPTGL